MKDWVLDDLLCQALIDNDTKKVSKLLEHGVKPFCPNIYIINKHEIFGAMYQLASSQEMVEIIMPYCEDKKDFLHWIFAAQSLDFAKTIFDSFFNHELTKEIATSMLTGILKNKYAWNKETRKCFAFLSEVIDAGADLNYVDEYKDTALNHTVEMSSTLRRSCVKLDCISEDLCINIITFLIEKGADINNPNANSVLFTALENKSISLALFLLDRGADPNMYNLYRGTAPIMAAVRLNKQIVQKLIDKGADINATDRSGSNALFYLIECRHEEIIPEIFQLLIQKGIRADTIDKSGDNILSHIMNRREFRLIDLILKAPVDLDKPDDDIFGRTLLIKLIESFYNTNYNSLKDERLWAIKKTIKAGVDVNKCDCSGQTPLILVARYTKSKKGMKIARLLLEYGADLSLADAYGKTAYDYAKNNRFLKKENYTEMFFHS